MGAGGLAWAWPGVAGWRLRPGHLQGLRPRGGPAARRCCGHPLAHQQPPPGGARARARWHLLVGKVGAAGGVWPCLPGGGLAGERAARGGFLTFLPVLRHVYLACGCFAACGLSAGSWAVAGKCDAVRAFGSARAPW